MHLKDNAVQRPSVWAIVLTHGGAEAITAACLDSLLSQRYPALTTLLVDNASFDGSGARLRDRFRRGGRGGGGGIEYLNTGANLGYTGGNNRGMRHALERGADYVLVLNNDTVLDPDCVGVLVESARDVPDLGAMTPKILFFDEPDRIWYAGGDLSYVKAVGMHRGELERDDPSEAPRLDEITFATGCCLLMPADAARRLGGFREDFFIYCEDVELSLRMVRAGLRLYYQPAARLLHREPPPKRRPDATPFQILHRDRNRRRVARLHFSLRQRLVFGLWFYPSRAVRFAQYVLRREWQRAAAVIRAAAVP